MTSLDRRRAAALDALSRRTPPTQRYPGETQPSGDMPDDPWQAEVYLAERDCHDDAPPAGEVPAWPEALQ